MDGWMDGWMDGRICRADFVPFPLSRSSYRVWLTIKSPLYLHSPGIVRRPRLVEDFDARLNAPRLGKLGKSRDGILVEERERVAADGSGSNSGGGWGGLTGDDGGR